MMQITSSFWTEFEVGTRKQIHEGAGESSYFGEQFMDAVKLKRYVLSAIVLAAER